jgi:hypothetical protein
MAWFRTRNRHLVPHDCARDQKSPGLDAVWDNLVLSGMQFFYSFDNNSARAGALDFGSHRDQEVREVLDFRFLGGAVNHGRPVGEHGRHHDIVGSEDG